MTFFEEATQMLKKQIKNYEDAFNLLHKAFIDLAEQTTEVRRLQNEYFNKRSPSVLVRAKEKERLLDETLKNILLKHEEFLRNQKSLKLFD